jgi:hypothetical protein
MAEDLHDNSSRDALSQEERRGGVAGVVQAVATTVVKTNPAPSSEDRP